MSIFNNITQLVFLLVLPLFAVQVRYMIYMRTREETRRTLVAGILEALPHDLAIMGMTLGVASYIVSTSDIIISFNRYSVILLAVALLPVYLLAFIPFLKNQTLRIVLGVLAYSLGAIAFYLVAATPLEYGGTW